jgi:hypothetical protein
MENVEIPLVPYKNFFLNSPKDGHQMVDVDWILAVYLFHICCNNKYALQYAHIHNSYINFNTPTSVVYKTLDSLLFHITKICISR